MIEGIDTDEGAQACLEPDPDQGRACAFTKGHDGPHGWEIDAEIDALANEIQMETKCSEEVAVVTAKYASGRIQDWKRGYESAYRTAEVARSLAVDFRDAAVKVVETYDTYMAQESDADMTVPWIAFKETVEELRKAVSDE